MTAGNSTPLSDGAAVALLASEEWAQEHKHPVLAYLVDGETAAVDYVNGREGLLMAPAYAVPRMLARNGLTLQDFDLYEIHEAFASQVLCDARRVGGPELLQGAPRPRCPARHDRPRQAQRQRQLARRRAPLRRDRRAHRRRPRQGAPRAWWRPRPDLDLRSRRPRRRRNLGGINAWTATPRSSTPRSARSSPSRSACRRRCRSSASRRDRPPIDGPVGRSAAPPAAGSGSRSRGC